jgi:hypothetical protein
MLGGPLPSLAPKKIRHWQHECTTLFYSLFEYIDTHRVGLGLHVTVRCPHAPAIQKATVGGKIYRSHRTWCTMADMRLGWTHAMDMRCMVTCAATEGVMIQCVAYYTQRHMRHPLDTGLFSFEVQSVVGFYSN